MFGLFSRKAKSAPVRPLPPLLPLAEGLPQGRPAQLVMRLLTQFRLTQGFMGSFDSLPGVTLAPMTDGILCLRDPDHLIGGILTNSTAALHFTVLDAECFAQLTLTPLLAAECQRLPDWWQAVSGALTCSLPQTALTMLDITVEDAEVDPLFSGRCLPGVSLTLAARHAA